MVGSMGTADPLDGVWRSDDRVGLKLVAARVSVFCAGVAGGILCESKAEHLGKLEALWRGADAGRIVDDGGDSVLWFRSIGFGPADRRDSGAFYCWMDLLHRGTIS